VIRPGRCLKAVVIAVLTVGLSACAGREGPAFRPEVIDPAQAVIYVYRPARQWAGRPIGVYIDQARVGQLGAGQYVANSVDPGERLVRAEGESDAVVRLIVSAGDSVFLEIRSSSWDERPVIEQPGEGTARQRIARTGRATDR
jgi:hypothetical protein